MPMLTRRQLLTATAAAVVLGRRPARAQSGPFDLVIAGGRVIDPSLRIDTVADVAVRDGRIAAVGAGLAGGATERLDATDRLVIPGLLDVHSHYARDVDGPRICLEDGVTGWVDAGSQGADGIAEQVEIARQAPQLGRLLINIGRAGILPDGDTMDLALADVAAAKAAIARYRDVIVGVKARLTEGVAADDVEVIRRAQEAATAFDLPLMIHMGQTRSPLARLFPYLKPGDVVTHMLAPPPNAIVTDEGRMDPAVLAARRRGVWFDVANGRTGHLRWDTVDQILAAGFWPDTFSTDANSASRTVPGVVDLPNIMSKFLDLGMSVPDVVERATTRAARVFPALSDRGTLHVGAPADVAILELREGAFEFLDNYGNTRPGTRRLFPAGTVLGGRVVPRG